MKTLIAIPAMEQIYTVTAQCLANLRPVDQFGTQFAIRMQVDHARNSLAKYAIEHGFDRILWIDSDMTFDADLMERLSADIDEGWDVVCGIFFKRKFPIEPVVYKKMGAEPPCAEPYYDYPQDALFPVAGCGFGGVMMRTDVLMDLEDAPFTPLPGLGEDFSFCVRMARHGRRIACDSRVKLGHMGVSVFSESMYAHPAQKAGVTDAGID